MKIKRILWFCGEQFSEQKMKTTGTWYKAMGEALSNTSDFELFNVTYGNVNSIVQNNSNSIKQWIIPYKEQKKYNKGSKNLISFIKKIDSDIKPDLIHVWGTENGFGFPILEAKLITPVLLDIQGILFSIVKNYYGGLSGKDLLKCTGLKEILKPKYHPFFVRRTFNHKGKLERHLISQINNISVQSDWVHSILKFENNNTNFYHTRILLRQEFYDAKQWECIDNKSINIFTASSGSIPYKGLHVIFKAINLLKNKYPNIKLNIGGHIEINKKYGLIRNGYTSWLLNYAKELNIEDNIAWLGMMDANEMINEMYKSNLVVLPSFVESYSLFMAESMMIGVPLVVSYAGAMPELAKHNESALYFPVGDHWSCARQIEKIIIDNELAKKLSHESRIIALQRNDQALVLKTQMDIYNSIIDSKSSPK